VRWLNIIFGNPRPTEFQILKAEISKIRVQLIKMRRTNMATKAEVLQAIADEKAQVLTAIDDFNAQIQALKDQIAAGDAITAADLDDIASAVHDIFVPTV